MQNITNREPCAKWVGCIWSIRFFINPYHALHSSKDKRMKDHLAFISRGGNAPNINHKIVCVASMSPQILKPTKYSLIGMYYSRGLDTVARFAWPRKSVSEAIINQIIRFALQSHVRRVLYFDGILPKRLYPPCFRMADRAFLAGNRRLEVWLWSDFNTSE